MFRYKKQISTDNLNREFEFLSQKITELELPEGFQQFVLYVISELFDNVKEHSNASRTVISLVIEKNTLSLEVTDNGIGLRNSYFKKGFHPKDDFSAIEFALAGLSTKEPKQRGFGLYTIKKMTQSLNGALFIKSGTALAKILKNKIESEVTKKKQGVSISLKAPIKKLNFYKYIE